MEKKKTCFKVPAFSVPSKTKDQICSSKCQESSKDMKKTTEKEKSVKSHEISTVGVEKETKNKSLKEGKKLNKKRDTNKASEDTKIVHPAGEGSEASGVTQHQGSLESACSDTTCMGDNLVVANQQEEEFTTDNTDTVDKTDKNEADEVSYIQLQPVKLPEVSEAPSETGKVKPALGKGEHEVSARGRERKPDKKGILPVRSLTDDEYESIFSAAVENVLNMNIDEWNPKSSNISSVSKSYKKTVGKKPVTASTMKKTEFVNGSASKDMEKYNEKKENSSELKKKKKSGHSQKNRENAHPLKLKVLAKNTVDRHQEENKSHIEVQKNSKRIEAQIENETTPAGSGDELVPKNVPEAPARKKLKKSSKGLKKAKLEPRELPFTSEEKAKSSKKKYKTSCIYKTGEKSKNPTENILESSDPNSERKTTDRQKEMLSREISLKGTWVQCCKADCLKWRYLPAVTDPSNVPEYWTCSMNTRTEYNSCDKEEEYYDESKHIYTKYCEGSIVWAKVAGYPWWPAMIEIDPDLDVYFETAKNNNMIPTYYHVVFLDDKVSRIWVKTGQLMPFDESHNLNDCVKRKKKGSSYEKEINAAKRNAIKALSYPLQERIKIFGFASRYKGHWGPTEDSTAKVTQNKSRNSKKQKTQGKEETIDDTTMDDVLGNTEALLSNVEEMLDSLDSDLDDSADDSDFSIDELKCDRKKRKSRHEKDTLTDKEELSFSDEEEEATLPEMSEAISKDVESADEVLQIDVVDISEETEKKCSNLGLEASKGTKLNLDPEIFTMELDDDRNTDSIENVTESGTKDLKTDDLTDKQDQCMVGKETRELKHYKKKLEKSMNKKCSEKPEYDNRDVTNDLKTISTAKKEVQTKSKSADKTKPSVGKIKKACIDEMKELSPENDTKQRSMDFDNEYGKENVGDAVASPGNESENLKLINNSGETTDTGKLPSETESFDKDDCTVTDQDRLVQYNLEKPDEEKDVSGTEGISLDDESDTEFDLVEHSMYDGTTGADKVLERETALLSREATLAQLDDEDSDPFDLMEE